LDAAPSIMEGEDPKKLPRHLALNFDRGADMDLARRKEIAAHGWEIAAADAYPWVIGVDEDVVPRPPTAAELRRFEAIALALAELVATESDLREAPRTIRVSTHAGPVDVTLASFDEDDAEWAEEDEALDVALAEDGDDAALLNVFELSPEA